MVRGSTTGPPKSTQNLSKSIEISRYVCVSASACVFYAQGVVKWGWICSNHSKQHGFGTLSCFGNLVFFLFLGLFWASFLLILGVLGRHFGSQKVDANFDRKTGMQVNPANPGKSRDRGSGALKYQSGPPWTARPPEALHIVAEARWRIYIYIYIQMLHMAECRQVQLCCA